MSSTIYKLKESIIWVLLLPAKAEVKVDLTVDYSVVYTEPELISFAQSGPLTLSGPQKAILVFPLTVLPVSVLDTIVNQTNVGTYREIITTMPIGLTTLTLQSMINEVEEAKIKTAEYEIKSTNQTPVSSPESPKDTR